MTALLSRFKDARTLQLSIAPDRVSSLLAQGREKMITTEAVPTINLARITFGQAGVELIIKQHLFDLVKAMGVDTTEDTIAGITDDIISGYGYFKLTELILAFKMMREGRFRSDVTLGNPLGNNAARAYGNISSAIICDCLHRFQYEYRNNVLDNYERERLREQQAASFGQEATYPEKRHHIVTAILKAIDDPVRTSFTFRFFAPYLNTQDMTDLEQLISEHQRINAENADLKAKVTQLEYIKDSVLKTAQITDPSVREKCFARLLELVNEYNDWFTQATMINTSTTCDQQ